MPDGEQSLLADRLNRLFEDVRRDDIRVSGAYPSALRTDARKPD